MSLELSGLDVLQGATKDIEVPSRGEVRVEWRVRAQQVRSATLTGKALTNEESDALELTLPVNIPGVKLGEALCEGRHRRESAPSAAGAIATDKRVGRRRRRLSAASAGNDKHHQRGDEGALSGNHRG